MISDKDKIDFYNVLYFSNEYIDFKQKAIWRAYRDFNRTLRFENLKEESDTIKFIKDEWENLLLIIINEVCEKIFKSEEEFDLWHEEKTLLLGKIQNTNFKLTVGQSQKWINMTLKYLFLLGEENIKGIYKNHLFFHIPIDNIIQERILNTFKIDKIKISWSRINDYALYLDYQKKIREKVQVHYKDISAFEFEFKLFNNKNFK